MKLLKAKGMVPRISETEQTALEAGTVWLDGEFFSGAPNFRRMLAEPYPVLNERERQYLEGPTEELCAMIDEYQIMRTRQIPDPVWRFLKDKGFFGLNISRQYGGQELSAIACSAVFGKISSRSLGVSAVVLVPNSLGPAELLQHYGTEEQKNKYLPRLANGTDVPCFALTEPEAGSDAASISSSGVVFKGQDGQLYMRMNWRKRYITLAPIATLLGLAFKLRDPENLLGKGSNPGITCALIPVDTPGVTIGQRHDPMGVPMPNGTTEGKDVILPVDQIIGGPSYAGRGWKMLMESLGAGRSISLPAQSVGGAKYVARVAGGYASVRRQFGTPIGRFEGIEEPLARIAGLTYIMEAARVLTCGNVDKGGKPSVISAIAKYNQTEMMRQIINDGMDVLGGAGISKGPNNLLADAYIGAPIAITVEGANILTRTLIIFGQGAIRCHPYAQKELRAMMAEDGAAFAKALGGHLTFFGGNVLRLLANELTRGNFNASPVPGPTAAYFKKLAWASSRFAVLTDLAMMVLGAKMKQKGKLTGRMADALSWMYLSYAVLHRWEKEGRRSEDLPLLHWAMRYGLTRIQTAFEGVVQNFSVPVLGPLLKTVGALLLRVNRLSAPPSDALGAKLANILREPGPQRDRLTDGIFLPKESKVGLGRLEHAVKLQAQATPVMMRVRAAVKAGKVPQGHAAAMIEAALGQGIITTDEAELVRNAEAVREQAVMVDSFSPEEYFPHVATNGHGHGQVRTPDHIPSR
ncbi:MAG: acyl-CoA dehydrogenase [Candidatus Xenobia bacterium]